MAQHCTAQYSVITANNQDLSPFFRIFCLFGYSEISNCLYNIPALRIQPTQFSTHGAVSLTMLWRSIMQYCIGKLREVRYFKMSTNTHVRRGMCLCHFIKSQNNYTSSEYNITNSPSLHFFISSQRCILLKPLAMNIKLLFSL